MGSVWRHAFAVLVLPVTVVVLVPTWIARRVSTAAALPASAPEWLVFGAGIVVFVVGVALFVASLARFVDRGKGTLAPWDPPTHMVTDGPYAYVRNPMISGVVLVLIAEALVLRSAPHLAWAGAFAVLNALYIPLFEEPALRARFGEEYQEYAGHVPRLIPRPRPWHRP